MREHCGDVGQRDVRSGRKIDVGLDARVEGKAEEACEMSGMGCDRVGMARMRECGKRMEGGGRSMVGV